MRSPTVHHPDPNPHALRTFAEGRYHELHPLSAAQDPAFFTDWFGNLPNLTTQAKRLLDRYRDRYSI